MSSLLREVLVVPQAGPPHHYCYLSAQAKHAVWIRLPELRRLDLVV
jgi:hypothetical protein